MKLTVKTDYCLRVLSYLQKKNGKVKIRQIAEDYEISKNHLSVVINSLSQLGYITTTPGPNGGVEFNKKFSNTSVAELVIQMEDLNIVDCFTDKSECTLKTGCKLKSMLRKSTNAFINELSQYKIKDLV